MYGFLVFAGLFVLLTLRPRRPPGVWELVIFHKTAAAVTATAVVGEGAEDAATVAAADGAPAVVLVTSYFLSKGYSGWTMLRAGGAETGWFAVEVFVCVYHRKISWPAIGRPGVVFSRWQGSL